MGLQAGKLWERVVFEARDAEIDETGQDIFKWKEIATLYSEVIYLPSSNERFKGEQFVAENFVKVRIRYRSDINVEDRMIINGAVYDITSRAIVNRKQALEIIGRARVD